MIDKKKTKAGFIWMFFGTAGQNILQFVALMVLARLLTPDDFGIVSAAMIIVGFIRIFSEFGVGPAIVQKQELSRQDVSTGKIISAVVGLLAGILVFSSAGLFERFMRIEGLAEVVQLLALVIPVSGLTVIGQSLLQRQLAFKKYMVCIFASFFVSKLFVAIPLALMGYGYYSLIVDIFVQNLALLALVSWLNKQYKGWSFNINSAKHLANYGFGQSLGKFSNYMAGQADNFIIGRYLGAASLGIYGRAYQLLMVPTNLIGAVLDKVMFPAMARIQNDNDKLVEIYLLSTSIIAIITVPITAFVYVASEEIILFLLGSQWINVVPILKILISVLFFRIGYKISDTLSKAKASVYRRAWRQALFAVSMLVFTYAGSHYGAIGITYGVILAIFFNYILMMHLSKHLIGFQYKRLFLIFFKNAAILFLITFLLSLIKQGLTVDIFYQLLVMGLSTIGITFVLYYVSRKLFLKELQVIYKFLFE